MITWKQIVYCAAAMSAGVVLITAAAFAGPGDCVDKNGYFLMTAPAGWKCVNASSESRTKIVFYSPEGAATISMIAEEDSSNYNDLSDIKQSWIEDHQQRFPRGKFMLAKTTMAGCDAIEVDSEFLPTGKSMAFFFFFEGAQYDLTYEAFSRANFETYRKTAMTVFTTLKPQKRTAKTDTGK